MKTLKITLLVILGIVLLLGLSWGLAEFGLMKKAYFKPKQENIDREVFENTQSYVEGKRQEAIKYRLEYMKCSDEIEKEAIRMTIVQSFANFDESKLEPELQSFIKDMKYGSTYEISVDSIR